MFDARATRSTLRPDHRTRAQHGRRRDGERFQGRTRRGLRLPVLLLLATAAILAGCSDDDTDEDTEEGATSQEKEPAAGQVVEEADEPDPDDEVGPPVGVQDLWVYESVTALRPGQEPAELRADLVAALEPELDAPTELGSGARFHPAPILDPRVVAADGQERDDLDVIAGLLEHDGDRTLAVLATPLPDADANVATEDRVRLDLTLLGEDLLAPGDALLLDWAFLQGLPPGGAEAAAEEAGLDGVELLAHRMELQRVRYAAIEVEDDPVVALYTGQVGSAIEGSTEMDAPGKAQPMLDGIGEGLEGCNLGLRCVSNFFDSFGGGASDSWDQALCNGGLGSDCGDDPPPDGDPWGEVCFGPDCGESGGEPHVTTFDGLTYAMMAAGEFILVRTDEVEVQKRTRSYQGLRDVSIGSAAAVELGGHRVSYDMDRAAGERLHIDGEPYHLDDIRREPMQLDDVVVSMGGGLFQIRHDATVVSIPDITNERTLDVFVQLDPAALEAVRQDPEAIPAEGLLGTATGTIDDDLTTRDGAVYDGPVRERDLYTTFVDSWRISDEESLFDYPEGLGTEDYTDPTMPARLFGVDDLDPEVAGWAEQVCRGAGVEQERALQRCVFDVGVTEDPGFAASAVTAQGAERIRQGLLLPERSIALGLTDAPAPGDGTSQEDADERPPDVAVDGPLPEAIDADWSRSMRSVLDGVEWEDLDTVAVTCPPLPPDTGVDELDRIWGTDEYWTRSAVCPAALHAGVLSPETGGTVLVELLERVPHAETQIEPRNGIEPDRWPRTAAGFRFLTE
ncbi:MAG: LCCL domain-containing protein [Nitriliruptoraceae bacterium]